MGKRSDFERNPRDFYPTPYEGVLPLLGHLPPACKFVEPCAGDGRLIRHLEKHGHECVYACDLEPQAEGIEQRDVLFFNQELAVPEDGLIITNPPWERSVLHDMIESFRVQATTWLLLDSAWKETVQAAPYGQYCDRIIAVGRLSWMENGQSGMDDCSWYRFQKDPCISQFVWRR